MKRTHRMTELILVRHGETVWHAENRYAGHSDIGLTELGLRQAERLGEWAADAGLAAIVTSDLDRARKTAEPAVRASGLDPITQPLLREVHFGAGEGLTKAEMTERFPEAVTGFHEAPAENPLPDGESGNTAIARALPALHDLVRDFPDERVLVVGHATLNRLLLCALLGLDPNRYRSIFPTMRNVARTTIRFDGEHTALLEFNADFA